MVEVGPFLGEYSFELDSLSSGNDAPHTHESLISVTCFIIVFPRRKGSGAKADGFIAPVLFGDGAGPWNKVLYMLVKHSHTELYFQPNPWALFFCLFLFLPRIW